jgi:hypothetical protein
MRNICLFLGVLILVACHQTGDPQESLTSGIQVQAYLGPSCPVVQIGTECPDQPYQATITILNSKGKKVLQFETDENGAYTVNLPPGDYVLHPESPKGMPLPYAGEQNFTVPPNTVIQLVVNYDSGIR